MLGKDNYKYVTFGSGAEVPPRLFDMDKDPLEMKDLVHELPDVRIRQGARLLSSWLSSLSLIVTTW